MVSKACLRFKNCCSNCCLEQYEKEKYKAIRDSQFTLRGHGFYNESYDAEEKQFIFKIISYNVLSQTLLEDNLKLYAEHDPAYLNWAYRSRLLWNELMHHDADILCLQEVEEKYKSSFFDKLEQNGYKGIFKKRTGDKCDGCAIYYKSSKFELVEYRTVEFYQPGISILDRDNIGIVVKLHPIGYPWRPIVVATTHLLYNPRRHDIKLAQIVVLLAEIERIAYNEKATKFKYHPVILTGDFNLQPYTGVYELIVNGSLKYDNLDRNKLMYTGPRPPSDYRFSPRTGRAMGKEFLPTSLGITDNCQHYGIVELRESASRQRVLQNQDVLIGLYNSDYKRKPQQVFPDIDKLTNLFQTGTLKNKNLDFYSVYHHENDESEAEATTRHDDYVTVDYILYTPLIGKEFKENQLQLLSRKRLPVISEWATFIKNIPNRFCPSDHLPLIARFFLRIPAKDNA